jgi:hypothetical protein
MKRRSPRRVLKTMFKAARVMFFAMATFACSSAESEESVIGTRSAESPLGDDSPPEFEERPYRAPREDRPPASTNFCEGLGEGPAVGCPEHSFCWSTASLDVYTCGPVQAVDPND